MRKTLSTEGKIARRSSEDLSKLLADCDADIRQGRAHRVSQRLASLTSGNVPRDWRQPIASVCRRAGLLTLGLRMLAPVVRGETVAVQPTVVERAEYGALLMRSGATREALAILQGIDPAKCPDSLLYRAFAHFSRWEYGPAIPFIREYMKTPANAYMALVAKVNLAAALVAVEKIDEAFVTINECVDAAKAGGHSRLLGNCLELRSQTRIVGTHRDLELARRDLETALPLFNGERTTDELYVRKWMAVIASIEEKSREPLVKFKQLAFERNDWENVRDAEFHALRAEFRSGDFAHLYFGSPNPIYRARLEREFGGAPKSGSYLVGRPDAPCLDVATGEIEGLAKGELNAGKRFHRVIDVLSRDLYRPLSVPELFAELCPDEYFCAFTSANRVHQSLRRLRGWLQENEIPLQVEQCDGRYSLKVAGEFSLRLSLERPQISGNALVLARLRESFNESGFAFGEAKKETGLPETSLRRVLQWAVEKGALDRAGAGAATRYKFAPVPRHERRGRPAA